MSPLKYKVQIQKKNKTEKITQQKVKTKSGEISLNNMHVTVTWVAFRQGSHGIIVALFSSVVSPYAQFWSGPSHPGNWPHLVAVTCQQNTTSPLSSEKWHVYTFDMAWQKSGGQCPRYIIKTHVASRTVHYTTLEKRPTMILCAPCLKATN